MRTHRDQHLDIQKYTDNSVSSLFRTIRPQGDILYQHKRFTKKLLYRFINAFEISRRVLISGKAWHNSFVRNRQKIEENLNICNPAIVFILNRSFKTFSSFALVDLSNCR